MEPAVLFNPQPQARMVIVGLLASAISFRPRLRLRVKRGRAKHIPPTVRQATGSVLDVVADDGDVEPAVAILVELTLSN